MMMMKRQEERRRKRKRQLKTEEERVKEFLLEIESKTFVLFHSLESASLLFFNSHDFFSIPSNSFKSFFPFLPSSNTSRENVGETHVDPLRD